MDASHRPRRRRPADRPGPTRPGRPRRVSAAACAGLAVACLLPVAAPAALTLPALTPLTPQPPDTLGPALAPAPQGPAEESEGQPLTERELRAALLDHMDFPAGWASDSPRAADRRGIGVPRPEETDCRELFDGEEETAARAGFARSQTGPFITTVAAAHEDVEAARGAVADVRDAASGPCGTFRAREGPEGSDVTVAYEAGRPNELGSELERLTATGHDSAALRYHRREGDGTPIIADVVIVRVGTHTVRVAQAGRDDAGTGSVAEIAGRAVEKLEEVHAGRLPAPDPNQPGTTEL
ncbi:hypothetical protein ACTWP5_09080 [Streptomyces sp. 4N509B]|uniref:hypothetical protein n=1 Tax=Streptomyces sp. 4N509B TaxID=3457413 RepID=UPI003FD151F8